MNLADLAARTGLPIRKLRYVVDHTVLPGLQGAASGHGVPRAFTAFEGFGIALAARLLDAAVTRKLVATALGVGCRPLGSPRTTAEAPLFRAYTVGAGTLEIGDGRYLRVRVPRRPGVGNALETGWLPLTRAADVPSDYTPVVCVTVEFGGLARAVQERQTESGSV